MGRFLSNIDFEIIFNYAISKYLDFKPESDFDSTYIRILYSMERRLYNDMKYRVYINMIYNDQWRFDELDSAFFE